MDSCDVKIESWPQRGYSKVTGEAIMQTGQLAAGVKLIHLPTGLYAICTDHRHQHKNRAEAFALLEKEVEAFTDSTGEYLKTRAHSLNANRMYIEADLALLLREYGRPECNAGALGCAVDALNEAINSIDSAILYLIEGVDA